MSYLYTFEADHLVPNLEEAIECFGRNLGIWPRTDWPLLEFPPEGIRAAFCPVGHLAMAPTYLSLLEPTDPDQWIGRAWQEQAPRPARYHCFAVVVDDVDMLIRHFDRLGITYLVSSQTGQLKGRRLFVGRSQRDPLGYDPSFDESARLEFLPVQEHPFTVPTTSTPPPLDSLPPGAYIRVESKSILVDDIYQAVKLFGKNFFLWPAPSTYVQDILEEGVRSITLPVGMPGSTHLELISPYDFNKPIGKWFKQYGKGHYHIRLLVTDLDSRLRELEAQGVAFDVRQPGPSLKYRRAWIDPANALGANLELVDLKT